VHAPPTRGSRASRSAQTRCGQPLRPVRGAWCGPAKPRTPDASIRTDGANAALTSRAAPADAPVTDLDSAHARTQATAPARLAGRSHARSQALGNGCAAARGSMCSHVTFVQAPPARRTLQQLERGRRLTHHAVDPVDRDQRHGWGERRERQSSPVGEKKERGGGSSAAARSNDASPSSAEARWRRQTRGTLARKRRVVQSCFVLASSWWRAQPAATGGSSRLARAASRKRQPLVRAMGTLSLLLVHVARCWPRDSSLIASRAWTKCHRPCTAGYSVFTRPSSISGKDVSSCAGMTSTVGAEQHRRDTTRRAAAAARLADGAR
jgi:hypothetical protein